MKKTLTLLLIVASGMLFSACGGGGSSGSDETQVGSSDTQIDVPVVQQKVDLSWTAPSTRTDGEPLALSELAGYRIYLGTSPDDLVLYEELLGVSATEISITIPEPGVYYFAVTAYDADGLESTFSDIVSKEVG